MNPKRLYKLILAGVFGLIFLPSVACGQQHGWPAVVKETKPWTRWWWMGSAVNQKDIGRELQALAKAGIGGVEIVPIYGATGYEHQFIPYLSPAWKAVFQSTLHQANKLGLGVDLSVGSGWPIGGPSVTLPHAATKLIIQEYHLTGGQLLQQKIIPDDTTQRGLPGTGLAALMAYNNHGEAQNITAQVATDGTLQWMPPAGNWHLVAAFTGKTRQKVKRFAPGGEGYVLNYFSKTAVQSYLQHFSKALGNTKGYRAVFNDSYEAWGTDWTPQFFELFEQRKGYSLKPFLKVFTVSDSSQTAARIKADYRAFISDLLLEHFAQPFTAWAGKSGAKSINQAHGSPANLLDIYAAADIPEGETFGPAYFPIPGLRRDSTDIPEVAPEPAMLQFASSAAHATGKKLISNETFTWLTEHFKTSWAQCKPTAEMAFLAGINHIFFHGTTYSPKEAAWPGWLFYASVEFVPANSLWPHINGLNEYITRCQSVLQHGQPDNELAVYWPVYDNWQQAKGRDMPFRVHDIDKWLHPTNFYKQVTALQTAGFSLDYISDNMLATSRKHNAGIKVADSGAAYKVLVVPSCTYMPLETAKHIIRLAEQGATVVWQGFPKEVPGYKDWEKNQQALQQLLSELKFQSVAQNIAECKKGKGRILVGEDIAAALKYAGVQRESMVDKGLQFIRRTTTNGKYYYIVNHTANNIDDVIHLQAAATTVCIMNPQTGVYGAASFTAKNNAVQVRLQLKSGEAVIVHTTDKKLTAPNWYYTMPIGEPVILDQPWKIIFTSGGPLLPKDTTVHTLTSWTNFNDAAASFSGTAVYSSTFNVKGKADDYRLALGTVHESARVWINEKEVGLVWSIPFDVNIGKYVQEGTNTIKVEVANLMSNRIRYMDKNGIKWRRFHDINFVNIQYKNFDASQWTLEPSGLIGLVSITPLQLVE